MMLLSVHKQGVFDGHNIKGKIKIMTEKKLPSLIATCEMLHNYTTSFKHARSVTNLHIKIHQMSIGHLGQEATDVLSGRHWLCIFTSNVT